MIIIISLRESFSVGKNPRLKVDSNGDYTFSSAKDPGQRFTFSF